MVKEYENFVVSRFTFDSNTAIASFFYGFDEENHLFCERIDFSGCYDATCDLDTLEGLLFHVHVALGVSYYKLFPTKNILVQSGVLDKKQKKFWHDFYVQGLGEFFYANKIDPQGLADFVSLSGRNYRKKNFVVGKEWLVPMGGGKDSIVTMELLREKGQEFSLFSFGYDSVLHQQVSEVVGKPRLLVKRQLSAVMGERLQQGYYNGHVPITGIVYFVSLVVCFFQKYQGVLFSNERSADFGNTTRKGMVINHQWSKSALFEHALQAYVSGYIHDDLICASVLRQWTEFRIVKEFSHHKQYFGVFSSCNRNFHLDGSRVDGRRCGHCPKCLSTYMLLRPFISHEEVLGVWSKELYDQDHLLPLFQDLWGVGGLKPFECVGEAEEYQYATWLILEKRLVPQSVILRYFEADIGNKMNKREWMTLGNHLLETYQLSAYLSFLKNI